MSQQQVVQPYHHDVQTNGTPIVPSASDNQLGCVPVSNEDGSRLNSALQTANANTPAISSNTTALAANANRKGWQIQNVGTNPLFVLLGNGASTTVFHAVLKGGTGASDGTGGSMAQMAGVIYTGVITIAGTSPSYVVTELT